MGRVWRDQEGEEGGEGARRWDRSRWLNWLGSVGFWGRVVLLSGEGLEGKEKGGGGKGGVYCM